MNSFRKDVVVCHQGDGIELTDSLTGLQIEVVNPNAEALSESERRDAWEGVRSLGFLDEGLSREEIFQRQLEFRRLFNREVLPARIRSALEFAVEKVPFYRERQSAYQPERISSFQDLMQLPMMTKSELRAQFPQGLVVEGLNVADGVNQGLLEFASTSGTTDERVQVLSDMELASVPMQYETLWGLPNSEENQKTAVFTTPLCMGTQCHLGKASFESRLKGPDTLFLNSLDDLFSMSREFVEAVVADLSRFKPDFLLVNPIYLHWLVRKAQEFSIEIPKPRLILSCYQFLSSIQKRELEKYFNAPVYSYYFATDLAGCRLAVECGRGRLHVREDHVTVEVCDASGLQLPEGHIGTLVFTALANRVMPLVRYVLGDVGRKTGEVCDCAIGDWDVIELHGRLKDMLQVKSRWLTTRDVDMCVSQVSGIDFYRLMQTGSEQFSIDIIPSEGCQFDEDALRAMLKTQLGIESLRIRTVRRLEPEPSLKYRLTSSQVGKVPSFGAAGRTFEKD